MLWQAGNPRNLPPQITHNHSQPHRIHILRAPKHVPPHRRGEHRIALHQALIIRRNDAPPLLKQILEIPGPNPRHRNPMHNIHVPLRTRKKVVRKMLLPDAGDVTGQAAQAHEHDPQMQEGDVGPGGEAGRQARAVARIPPPAAGPHVLPVGARRCRSVARAAQRVRRLRRALRFQRLGCAERGVGLGRGGAAAAQRGAELCGRRDGPEIVWAARRRWRLG